MSSRDKSPFDLPGTPRHYKYDADSTNYNNNDDNSKDSSNNHTSKPHENKENDSERSKQNAEDKKRAMELISLQRLVTRTKLEIGRVSSSLDESIFQFKTKYPHHRGLLGALDNNGASSTMMSQTGSQATGTTSATAATTGASNASAMKVSHGRQLSNGLPRGVITSSIAGPAPKTADNTSGGNDTTANETADEQIDFVATTTSLKIRCVRFETTMEYMHALFGRIEGSMIASAGSKHHSFNFMDNVARSHMNETLATLKDKILNIQRQLDDYTSKIDGFINVINLQSESIPQPSAN